MISLIFFLGSSYALVSPNRSAKLTSNVQKWKGQVLLAHLRNSFPASASLRPASDDCHALLPKGQQVFTDEFNGNKGTISGSYSDPQECQNAMDDNITQCSGHKNGVSWESKALVHLMDSVSAD